MYPFIHIPTLFTLHLLGRTIPVGGELGTFGLMLWLAAVCACWVLQQNFNRWHVDADSISIVLVVTVAGVVGAKLWHVMDTPGDPILDRSGFAWFGGLLVGILTLIWQGRVYKTGSLRMLDLATPAAAVGYGMGRLGCLTSGDGDYGIPTTLPWGISFPHGLVPTTQRVHPTPIYELIVGLIIGWILWHRGAKRTPVGQLTGEYLILSGLARFLVEFIRINPRVLWGMSNAQLASIGSIVAGAALLAWGKSRRVEAQIESTEVIVATRS
jgi:phosphatidylglycerol:prolipoprotein diacylglycerol transferase